MAFRNLSRHYRYLLLWSYFSTVLKSPLVIVAENQPETLTYHPMPFPTVSTEDNSVMKMLKFKITTKGIRNIAEEKPCQGAMKVVLKHGDRVTVGGKKCPEANDLMKQHITVKSSKRKLENSLDDQRGKRQKMDRGLKFQCTNILKELMNHPDGWIFREPVDPVKLRIPDYFSIITEPMDLGTIKLKLEGNVYFGVEEFVSDVRLTFSNAMLYNPPENRVHQVAKLLNGNFSRRWKLVEAKMKQRNQDVVQPSFVEDLGKHGEDSQKNVEKNDQGMEPTGLDKAPLCIKLGTCMPMALEDKRSFRLEVMQLIDQKMTGNLQAVFQKFGLTDLNKHRVDSFINSTNDETLWKLRRELKAFLNAKSGKARPANIARDGRYSLKKPFKKENSGESICKAGHHGDAYAEAKCSSCYNVVCHCSKKNGSQISISDISSDGSSALDHSGDSKLDSEVKHHVAVTSSCGVDSDGPGVVLNEERNPHHSTPAATALEGWNSFNVQMSPKKALRAAMLKSRFADTIFKATHQAVLDNGQKSDAVMVQQEKAKLEKEQLEEKARIEAEIKAAKEASRRKEQDGMKMRRERERVAARMALEKMRKTVDLYENLDIMKDLEKLCCCLTYAGERGAKGICPRNPLERLGLFIKHDYVEEDGDDIQEGEEGEIL